MTRALLSGARVTYAGERFRVSGRALAGGGHPVPVFLAASGPQALSLAGEIADGVLVSAAASVEFVRWPMAQVKRVVGTRPLERAGLVYAAPADVTRFRRALGWRFGARTTATIWSWRTPRWIRWRWRAPSPPTAHGLPPVFIYRDRNTFFR